ncbi:predicted protein [Histoplasma capsulatum var. duboisii H88]|uniref:Predicted protein n=2 Tax=Ajellomyces capsulatus TaxID=5037 RepID=F0U6Z7_AJEC8|nr:predicted protein [Histoplasma capsulatum H143]EGC42368.1 predicted protein [Histoplasma capsulatum var. duboisii H88]
MAFLKENTWQRGIREAVVSSSLSATNTLKALGGLRARIGGAHKVTVPPSSPIRESANGKKQKRQVRTRKSRGDQPIECDAAQIISSASPLFQGGSANKKPDSSPFPRELLQYALCQLQR